VKVARSGPTKSGLTNEPSLVIHFRRAPTHLRDAPFSHLLRSERVWTNHADRPVLLFDIIDSTAFFVDRSKCPVRPVQPDEPLLRSANPPKSLLLCGRAKRALFDYEHALSPGFAVSRRFANDVAAQAQEPGGYRPCPDAGPSQDAD